MKPRLLKARVACACAARSLRAWKTDWRVIMTLLGLFIFSFSCVDGIGRIARAYGEWANGCAFVALFNNPTMLLVYGSFTTLLFANIPPVDAQIAAVLTRSGRHCWIWGQFGYIGAAALAEMLVCVAGTLCALAPNVRFAGEWGKVIRSIFELDVETLNAYHIVAIFPESILIAFSPALAMFWALLLFWLTTVFLGSLMMWLNLRFGYTAGCVAGGILTLVSAFGAYAGFFAFNGMLTWISPLSWVTLVNLNVARDRAGSPPLWYALTVLSVGAGAFAWRSAAIFRKMDISVQEGGIL